MFSIHVDCVDIAHGGRVDQGDCDWDGDMKCSVVKVGRDGKWPSEGMV